jgi:phosphohistidine phosphatase
MKSLLLMRHAKSSWKRAELSDVERPLNKRGQRDAPRMGRWLRQRDLVPDWIVTSSARRARETADAVAEASGFDGEIQVQPSLYLGAPEHYLQALAAVPRAALRVLALGHNPGLEELVEDFTGEAHTMPTGAIAVLRLPVEAWSEVSESTVAKLEGLIAPREIN